MAWETRKGNQYFYQSVRDADGSVRKIYLGRGAKAVEAANQLAAKKERAQARKVELQERQMETTMLEVESHQIELGIEQEFASQGWHNPKGRGWRPQKNS